MIKNQNVRLYEALAHDVAMDAAERRELTPELREESRRLHAFAQKLIAQMDHDYASDRGVRPAIVAMDRPSMLARFAKIFEIRPRGVFAFRDFSHMSDDDLRSALEDAESLLERSV